MAAALFVQDPQGRTLFLITEELPFTDGLALAGAFARRVRTLWAARNRHVFRRDLCRLCGCTVHYALLPGVAVAVAVPTARASPFHYAAVLTAAERVLFKASRGLEVRADVLRRKEAAVAAALSSCLHVDSDPLARLARNPLDASPIPLPISPGLTAEQVDALSLDVGTDMLQEDELSSLAFPIPDSVFRGADAAAADALADALERVLPDEHGAGPGLAAELGTAAAEDGGTLSVDEARAEESEVTPSGTPVAVQPEESEQLPGADTDLGSTASAMSGRASEEVEEGDLGSLLQLAPTDQPPAVDTAAVNEGADLLRKADDRVIVLDSAEEDSSDLEDDDEDDDALAALRDAALSGRVRAASVDMGDEEDDVMRGGEPEFRHPQWECSVSAAIEEVVDAVYTGPALRLLRLYGTLSASFAIRATKPEGAEDAAAAYKGPAFCDLRMSGCSRLLGLRPNPALVSELGTHSRGDSDDERTFRVEVSAGAVPAGGAALQLLKWEVAPAHAAEVLRGLAAWRFEPQSADGEAGAEGRRVLLQINYAVNPALHIALDDVAFLAAVGDPAEAAAAVANSSKRDDGSDGGGKNIAVRSRPVGAWNAATGRLLWRVPGPVRSGAAPARLQAVFSGPDAPQPPPQPVQARFAARDASICPVGLTVEAAGGEEPVAYTLIHVDRAVRSGRIELRPAASEPAATAEET